MPKTKKYTAANDYDTSVLCAVCGAAIHINMLVFVSKGKVKCPHCNAISVVRESDTH